MKNIKLFVFVEVQLIKIHFCKNGQTRGNQNIVKTTIFKSEYYNIYKYKIFTDISSKDNYWMNFIFEGNAVDF